jgi:hypothetical protein
MNQDMGISPAISRVVKSTPQAAKQQDPIARWVWHVEMMQIVALAALTIYVVSLALGLSGVR